MESLSVICLRTLKIKIILCNKFDIIPNYKQYTKYKQPLFLVSICFKYIDNLVIADLRDRYDKFRNIWDNIVVVNVKLNSFYSVHCNIKNYHVSEFNDCWRIVFSNICCDYKIAIH